MKNSTFLNLFCSQEPGGKQCTGEFTKVSLKIFKE